MRRLTMSIDACVETLALLIAIAWADGKLEDSEKKGVLGAAGVLNLSKEMRERLDKLLEKPMPVDQLLVEGLSSRDKAFMYIAGSWLTGVDGEVDAKEVAMLDEATAMLGIEGARKTELNQIARDLEPIRMGERAEADWANELVTLFKAIPKRLENTGEDIDVVFG